MPQGLHCLHTEIKKKRREIGDLIRVVIFYEISYEMTTSVRFCLLYDCFKRGFIALTVDNIFNGKDNVVTVTHE